RPSTRDARRRLEPSAGVREIERPSKSVHVVTELVEQSRLGLGSDDLLDDLTAVEDLQSGNGRDAVFGRELGVLVRVELDDVEFVLVACDFFEYRGNHSAGCAPFGPEVDKYRFVAFQDFLVEVGIGDVLDVS